MQNIPTKGTGDQYTANEFNGNQNERENAVTDSGQSLGGDAFQLSRAAAINGAGADYYDDSGLADAYVLSKPGTSSLRSPPAYFEGMRIRFRPTNPNTGGSTVNVAGVDVVPILKEDGATALSPGDLVADRDAECRYDITAGAFLLKSGAPDATQTSRGIAYLGDQMIILENNAVDPNNDIDFSVGKFTFDDGTGEAISPTALSPPYTKQLDGVFVGGDAQGGLDTGTKAPLTTYHCFAVFDPTNGLSDFAFTTNPAGPSLVGNLVNYTKKRLVGAILTDGSSNIIAFLQVKNTFFYRALIVDAALVSTPTARTNYALTTPSGRKTEAILNCAWRSSATVGGGRAIIISDPDGVDQAPVFNSLFTFSGAKDSPSEIMDISAQIRVMTDTSSQIAVRATTTTDQLHVTTVGWVDHDIEVF